MSEPAAYHPIDEHPWPPSEEWFIVWWNAEHGHWSAATGPMPRDEAVRRLHERRIKTPHIPLRLVKETRTYTAGEE